MTGFSPWAENSFWQKPRAKNPRSSSRRSRSMMKAPFSLVSVKITCVGSQGSGGARLGHPAEIRPQLAGGHQLLDLIDAPIPGALEVGEDQADGTVGVMELAGALARVPLRLELGEHPGHLGEVGPVVALVGSGVVGKGDLAAGHRLLHDLRDVANAV